MSQANSPQQTRIDSIHKEYSFVYGILTGVVLVLVAIWIGSTIFSDTEGYLTNVFTEVISVIATIFVIDRIHQWRADERLKDELLSDLHSESSDAVLNALRRLREKHWVDNNYPAHKNFHRANWEGAYIGELNFEKADLRRANFNNTMTFDGINSKPVNFKDADLFRIRLVNASLENANLQDVRLDYAQLKNVNLYKAHLEGADLEHADLQGANLDYALAKSTNFSHANLSNATLLSANLQKADMRSANLSSTSFLYANLSEANLFKIHAVRADFRSARLELANLYYANLEDVNLRSAHLDGSDLRSARLDRSNLQSTHLRGADLMGASLANADLTGAHLEGANLHLTNMDNAILSMSNGENAVTLPDGDLWTSADDLERFTNREHPHFQLTLEKINKIRIDQKRNPLRYYIS